MNSIIINENQKGLLFKKGKYVKLLNAGKYPLSRYSEVELVNIDDPLYSDNCSLERLLLDENISKNVSVVEVKDQELALHFIDGIFSSVIYRGKHAFWICNKKHEYKIIDISEPEVSDDIPRHLFSKISSHYFQKISVAEYEKARLFYDEKFVKVLDAGTYYFWNNGTKIDTGFVDTRLTQLDITGQEILTQDKVSLRINFVCNYRVTDYVKVLTEINDFLEQIHVAAQLALREYVGKYKLDEILENKNQMSEFVLSRLKSKEKELFVEIVDAGVKDIILPGEIREIMNTVLIAEKRAQANVITRREEVASTRSLLNTAKLMDENQTLYKLKELEYIERICDNVGNINLSGNSDILTQLTSILNQRT